MTGFRLVSPHGVSLQMSPRRIGLAFGLIFAVLAGCEGGGQSAPITGKPAIGTTTPKPSDDAKPAPLKKGEAPGAKPAGTLD